MRSVIAASVIKALAADLSPAPSLLFDANLISVLRLMRESVLSATTARCPQDGRQTSRRRSVGTEPATAQGRAVCKAL